jgi:hypothetical protein
LGRFAPIHLTLKDLGILRFWQKHINSPDASLSLDTHIGGSRVGESHLKFCPRQPYARAISLFLGVTKVKRYLQSTLHDNHPKMTNRTPGVPMPKAIIHRPNAVKLLDPDDPNVNAFKLVITFVFCCDVYFLKKTQYSALFLPYPHGPFCINSQTKAADDRSGGRRQSG